MLQYDKLYQSLKKVTRDWHAGHLEWSYCWYYLKFYENGIVIKSLIGSDNISVINNWFKPGATNAIIGNYKFISRSSLEIRIDNNNLNASLVAPDTIIVLKHNI